MTDKAAFVERVKELILTYESLSLEYRKAAAESKAEEYVLRLFDLLGWKTLGEEIIAQKRIKKVTSTDRVDYSFKIAGLMRPSMYVEVKKFARDLSNPEWTKQAIEYGKNGGARWVVLTNFAKIRIFNSDFYSDPDNAELFREIDLKADINNPTVIERLLLLSRDACLENKLDEYAKDNKKWKESADIEGLLTSTLLAIRKKLVAAIYEQNWRLFEEEKNKAEAVDSGVQLLFDRLIFCRILEDNGVDEERRLRHVFERWEKDKRAQFYADYLVPFFNKMSETYDSNIFKSNGINSLRIKNEDFIEGFSSFYANEEGLKYHFDAIPADVLGHVYENYLSYKAIKKGEKIEIAGEMYERKRFGIYFTPEFLVNYLVESTLGRKLAKCKTAAEVLSIRVLDPACGSGTFLIRAYDEFAKWYKQHPALAQSALKSDSETGIESFLDSVLENCIYGIDIDPRAAELARLNLFIRAIHNPKILPHLHILTANSLVSESGFEEPDVPFAFEQAFPLVHEAGGFDVIATNPPWEKWKPNSQEFFEPYFPGFKSLPAQEAKQKIQELLKRPQIKLAWKNYLAHYEALSEVFRNEDNYEYQSAEAEGRQVSGDLDLYKLFTERAYQLLKDDGVAGMVIPSGIYTDLGAKGLRGMLFNKCEISGLYGFENKKKLFPAVHSSYKPTLLTFRKGKQTKSFSCAFFLHTQGDLARAVENPTNLTVDFIKSSSPISWSILEIKTLMDYAIVQKLLKYPPLGKRMDGTWNIDISRGFDMTNDSALFRPYGKGVPMLEGKNIHQYTNRWKEAPKPQYSVLEGDIDANIALDSVYHKDYWLAYRLIASSTNERTVISTVIPPGYVCGHSIAIIKIPSRKVMCFLCGVLNSFVIDYLMRQKVSANVTMFNLKEMPVPRIESGQEFEVIVKKVVQLVATTNEFDGLKKEIGLMSPINDEQDRQLTKARIDAIVAKLYGINKGELEHILSQFPIVDDKIKEQVMQEYSKM